jgi:hypothetical protein
VANLIAQADMTDRTCKYPGCSEPYHARGWCGNHYSLWHEYGTPDGAPRNARPANLPGEQWHPVVGWEGFYEISSRGRVWSIPRTKCRGAIRKTLVAGAGYAITRLSARGVKRSYYVHQMVMEAFVGPCPEGQQVRHLNGNPLDNRWPENLAYGTPTEDRYDQIRIGTHFNAAKTRCREKHEYTPENTYYPPRGGRVCRTCARAYKRAYKKRQKAA